LPSFVSGEYVSAADLNANITGYDQAVGSTTSATVTTTAADLDGCTVTVTTAVASTVVMVVGTFDVESTGTTDVFFGQLLVAGSAQAGSCSFKGTGRAVVSRTWMVTLGAAGSYTLKLQVDKINNSNTVTIYSTGSSIAVWGNGLT